MTSVKIACAAGALLLASMAHSTAAPVTLAGGWIYDGRQPPACDIRDVRLRHFEGDGHGSGHEAHAHLGHGHTWSKRNFKGHSTKPPCYVRRASVAIEILSGDLS